MRSLILTALLVAPLSAQALEPGYVTRSIFALPNGATNALLLHGGTQALFFTGTDLVLKGFGVQRSVLHFTAPVFGSFTIQVGRDLVLFGESSHGDLWLVPLTSSGSPRVVANLPLNYDAVSTGPDEVIVSAKTGGFGSADNDLVHIDLRTGATDLVARIGGASGPVAWTDDGLFYATASASFPAPPGSTQVLHWGRAQVRGAIGPGHLGAGQAFVMAAGLDSAGDLVVDADFDVIVTDWANDRVYEVSRGPSGGRTAELRRSSLLSYTSGMPVAGGLHLAQPPGLSPQFEPFQPEAGGVLHVHESTYGGASQIRVVVPRRPVTSAPGVVMPGRFDVTTVHGPAGGSGLLAVGRNLLLREFYYPVNGFDQSVRWDPSMLAAWDTLPITFDAQGVARLTLSNPGTGGSPISVGVQLAFVDANLEVLGSAAPILLNLR